MARFITVTFPLPITLVHGILYGNCLNPVLRRTGWTFWPKFQNALREPPAPYPLLLGLIRCCARKRWTVTEFCPYRGKAVRFPKGSMCASHTLEAPSIIPFGRGGFTTAFFFRRKVIIRSNSFGKSFAGSDCIVDQPLCLSDFYSCCTLH